MGGDRVSGREYPWMATIMTIRGNGSHLQLCGGCIVDSQTILTAGHCILDTDIHHVHVSDYHVVASDRLIVQIGSNSLHSRDILRVAVHEAIIHPLYDYTNRPFNDLGIIRLAARIHFSSRIQPICLPVAYNGSVLQESSLLIAGWGRTHTTQ